jgi:hypothetical protein
MKPTKKMIANQEFVDCIFQTSLIDLIDVDNVDNKRIETVIDGVNWSISKYRWANTSPDFYEVRVVCSNIDKLLSSKLTKREYKKRRIHKTCWIYKYIPSAHIDVKNDVVKDGFHFQYINLK